MTKRSQTCETNGPQPPSREFLDSLQKWLALFVAHFRQELTELSVVAYQIGLQDLTVAALNRGCERALKECDFFPKVHDIRSKGTGSGVDSLQMAIQASEMYEKSVHWAKMNYNPDLKNAVREELPPTVEYAMRICGGMAMILNEAQQYWVHKNFVAAYIEMQTRLRVAGISTRDDAKEFIGNLKEHGIINTAPEQSLLT